MVKLTKEDIVKLASMSQIEASLHEIPILAEKIDSVLNYASIVKNIAQGHNIELYVSENKQLRSDIVVKTNRDIILDCAPLVEENYFVVPKIL